MPVTRAPERARAASATRVRRFARACGALVVLGFAAFCVLLLLLRYVVMPQVPAHRDAIADFLSHRIGAPVTIDALATAWDGWNPKLVIDGFRLRDPQGTQSVLELPHVELVAAWTSLAVLQLRLKALAIERPMLAIARDADGVVHVAGLEFDPRDQGGRSPFLAWLLRQREISVRDAVLAWTDELRAAPTVTLTQVDVKLENELGHHRFGATGVPPAALASPFDVRGDLTGIGAGTWQKAKGRLYLRLDYADVAAWRAWVPLPLPIDSGTGALRLWFDVADRAVTAVVADAELADVRVAIESSLPPLELQHIVGRLQWQRTGTRSVVSGHDMSFTTKSGDVHALTDFGVDVDAGAGGAGAHGALTFARADLAPLAAVAAQLPLPAAWREELATRSPHGAITGGRFTWQGPADDPAHWTAHGTLVDVGASARGAWPGIARLSGTFDGDDAKGSLKLATRAGAVEVPGELRDEVKVDRLDGTLRWSHEGGALRIDLDDVAFANADAAGAVSGFWRALPQGPGQVELNAQFTRGNIARIANYVPVDFNAHARDWLRRALVKGDAGKGLLALKGNLADFPFSDAHPGRVHDRRRCAQGDARLCRRLAADRRHRRRDEAGPHAPAGGGGTRQRARRRHRPHGRRYPRPRGAGAEHPGHRERRCAVVPAVRARKPRRGLDRARRRRRAWQRRRRADAEPRAAADRSAFDARRRHVCAGCGQRRLARRACLSGRQRQIRVHAPGHRRRRAQRHRAGWHRAHHVRAAPTMASTCAAAARRTWRRCAACTRCHSPIG